MENSSTTTTTSDCCQHPFDTLILSGNSTNAMVTLGALQYLYDNSDDNNGDNSRGSVRGEGNNGDNSRGTVRGEGNDDRSGDRSGDAGKKCTMSHIVNFIGTSSGSIIALMLAIGYRPIDVLAHICVEKAYKKISKFNISNLFLLGKGLMGFDPIMTTIESMVIERLGAIPTLLELKRKYGKKLVVVAYNLTDDRREYISYETYPDLPVTVATRMSSTFPFIFDPFEYNGRYYIDGGIVDNFAIEYGEKIGSNCIAIFTRNPQKPFTPGDSANNMSFLTTLVQVFINSISEDKIKRTHSSKIITLDYNVNFFNFDSSNREIIKLFDHGFEICRRDFAK